MLNNLSHSIEFENHFNAKTDYIETSENDYDSQKPESIGKRY